MPFSEVYAGEDLALGVGSGKVEGGSSSVWGEGLRRQGPRGSKMVGTISLPRPIALGSNTAQPSAR